MVIFHSYVSLPEGIMFDGKHPLLVLKLGNTTILMVVSMWPDHFQRLFFQSRRQRLEARPDMAWLETGMRSAWLRTSKLMSAMSRTVAATLGMILLGKIREHRLQQWSRHVKISSPAMNQHETYESSSRASWGSWSWLSSNVSVLQSFKLVLHYEMGATPN